MTLVPVLDATAPRHPRIDFDGLGNATLDQIAAGLAASPLWHDHVRHNPERRQPVLLLDTPPYEAWIIGWMPGQGVEMHDHGGARAAIACTEGTLTERTLVGAHTLIRTLQPGTQHTLDATVVHEVFNDTTQPASSIHVYSPRLHTMTFYDTTGGIPLRTEHLTHAAPTLTPRAITRVLHPTRGHYG